LANELDSYWLLSGGLDSQLVGGFLVGELVSPCTGGGARVDGTGPYVYHNAASIYSTVLAQYVFFTTLRSAIDLMCVTSSQQDVQMRPPPSVAFFLVWCLMDNDIYCLPILHSQALSKDQWPSDEEWGSPTAVCEAT
jgi:hypothetical protein